MERQTTPREGSQSHFLAVAINNVAAMRQGIADLRMRKATIQGDAKIEATKAYCYETGNCLALILESISVYIDSVISPHYPEKRRLQELSTGLVQAAKILYSFAVLDYNSRKGEGVTYSTVFQAHNTALSLVRLGVFMTDFANTPRNFDKEGDKKPTNTLDRAAVYGAAAAMLPQIDRMLALEYAEKANEIDQFSRAAAQAKNTAPAFEAIVESIRKLSVQTTTGEQVYWSYSPSDADFEAMKVGGKEYKKIQEELKEAGLPYDFNQANAVNKLCEFCCNCCCCCCC